MTKITDLRKKPEVKPLTFAELNVGDWFECVEFASLCGLRLKTSKAETKNMTEFCNGGVYESGNHVMDARVRRLDVELIIKGEL